LKKREDEENYKLQNTNNMAHELHELSRIGATSNEKLLQGVKGGRFSRKESPLAAGGKSCLSKVIISFFYENWTVP
jgi:hypothetical protein